MFTYKCNALAKNPQHVLGFLFTKLQAPFSLPRPPPRSHVLELGAIPELRKLEQEDH